MNPPPTSRAELIERMKIRFSQAGNPGATNHDGRRGICGGAGARGGRDQAAPEAPGWHTALVVAHEGINRLVLSWACGAGLAAMAPFEQDTGSINMLDFDLGVEGEIGGRWSSR